jgi:hypothetical protein
MDAYDFYALWFWPFLIFQVPNILLLGRAAAAKGVDSFWLNLVGFVIPPLAWVYVIASPAVEWDDED